MGLSFTLSYLGVLLVHYFYFGRLRITKEFLQLLTWKLTCMYVQGYLNSREKMADFFHMANTEVLGWLKVA